VDRKHSGGAPVVRNGPSSSLCSDAQSLFFSSPCMLSLSLLCLPQKLLFLFRFLLCCCWWQLLLATLLVTRRNDGGAASNGGGRETRERDELLFFSPILLFFCSFLLFSRQLKSSPLCSSTFLSFSKILPPLFLSFSKNHPPSWFCSLPCIYRQPGERFTIPCPSAGHGGVGVAEYGCVGVGMGHAGFLGKWGGERQGKNNGKNFKNLLLPCLCICRGEEAALCRSKRHRAVFFFFLRKGKKIWG